MREHKGFTLTEVLIALVILSISLTAIIKATSSNIQNTKRLEDNTCAQWVAYEAFNLIKSKVIPLTNGETNQETTLSGRKWRWHAVVSASKWPGLKRITVHIYQGKSHILTESDTMLGDTV